MADSCCGAAATRSAPSDPRQRRILMLVMAINAAMFAVELWGGLWANSSALLADSVDMLMDATVYAVSLLALNRAASARARAALLNGTLELIMSAAILLQVGFHAWYGVHPGGLAMQLLAGLALAANLLCAGLLLRFRHQDINMRAVWLCTRNDIAGNAGTIVAGLLVSGFAVAWPDLLLGTLLAMLFIHTSLDVITQAVTELRQSSGTPAREGDAK